MKTGNPNTCLKTISVMEKDGNFNNKNIGR